MLTLIQNRLPWQIKENLQNYKYYALSPNSKISSVDGKLLKGKVEFLFILCLQIVKKILGELLNL